jgi:hypothetical protein
MAVRVSTAWTFHGLNAIVLENTLLRVILLPQLGGKIWQITYKPSDRDLLWQHPRLTPRIVPFHAVYDDVFCGGWDELFPNDLAEEINGERLPDHGEVWTLPWNVAIERDTGDEVVLHLSVETPISVVRVEKWITLRDGEAKLRLRYQLSALGSHHQPFLWKLHAAMALSRDSRIDLPAQAMYVEDFGPPRTNATGVTYTWPYLADAQGIEHDMRHTLPASARVNEFQYATELTAGWCALTHPHERLGFGLAFDRRVLPSCWLFATYGGWRNLSTVVLEPCTGYPISLAEGVQNGTHQVLHGGDTINCDVVATVFTGGSGVSAIDGDGNVTLLEHEGKD